MTVDTFKQTLVSKMAVKNIPVYHMLAAPEEVSPVLCWQELGTQPKHGSDKVVARLQRMQVDYFSKTEYDNTYKYVEQIFGEMVCGFNHDGKTFDQERQEWRDIWTVRFLEAV